MAQGGVVLADFMLTLVMHFKKYVLVFCLFLFGMGFSFGQNQIPKGVSNEAEPIIEDSFKYHEGSHFNHQENAIINIPYAYKAVDEGETESMAYLLGLKRSPNTQIVTIMVPKDSALSPHNPYIVVLYYEGLVPEKDILKNIDKDEIFNSLSTEKNARKDIKWKFDDWVPEDVIFDKKRKLFKMNAYYRFYDESEVPQRQIAYWQFGNKGIYHYVWICPEQKIFLYQPPRTELDNLVAVFPGFVYENTMPDVAVSEELSIESLVCREDLGPSTTPPDLERLDSLSNSRIKPSSPSTEEPYEDPESAPVFGLPALFMILGQLSWYQLGGIIGVPIITTLVIFLFNSGAGKRKKKEVPWD